MGGNIAKRPELAERHEVVRRLESDFAVVRADVTEVRGVFLDAPVVEEDDWFSVRNRRLDCIQAGGRVRDQRRRRRSEPLKVIRVACYADCAVVPVLDSLEDAGEDVASRRTADAE